MSLPLLSVCECERAHFLSLSIHAMREPHQRVEVVADQRSVVDDVSLEDDEEEEESQHHVTKVTEYVVECTALGRGK